MSNTFFTEHLSSCKFIIGFILLSFFSSDTLFACDLNITTTSNSITVEGLDAPHVIFKVFNPNWSLNYDCVDNCNNTVSNLAEGTYHISIRQYDSSWSLVCEQIQDVTINGGDPPPPPPPPSDCDVTWTTTNSSITVNGLSAPHVIFKLFTPSWSIQTQCFDNCSDPLTVTGLISGATYHISYNLYDANWQQICEATEDVVITDGGNNNGPDLQLADLQIDDPGSAGAVMDYTVDLRNTGNETANGSYTITAYLSNDNIFSSTDAEVGVINTGNTGVGTIQDVAGAVTLPLSVTNGTYYLILLADSGSNITETNESNNTVMRSFTVSNIVSGDGCGFFKEDAQTYPDGINVPICTAEENADNYEFSCTGSQAGTTRTVDWRINKEGVSLSVNDTETPIPTSNDPVLNTTLLNNGDYQVSYTTPGGTLIWSRTATITPGPEYDVTNTVVVNNRVVYDGFLVVGTLVAEELSSGSNTFWQFSIKLDEDGNITNSQILGNDAFGGSDFFFTFFGNNYLTSDGYVFTVSQPNLLSFIKFNNSGGFEWLSSFASDLPSNRFEEIEVSDDQQFIYAVNVNNQILWIDKVNINTGEKVYKVAPFQTYGLGGFSQFAEGILPTNDGGIITAHNYTVGAGPGEPSKGLVYGKIDANGNEVWSDIIETEKTYHPLLETSDGGFLFLGNDINVGDSFFSTFKVTEDGFLAPSCDGGPSGGNDIACDLSYTVSGGDLVIDGTGLDAPHVIIKVFNSSWQTIFSCTDDCGTSIVIPNASSSVYHINVQLYNSSWQKTCEAVEDINLSINPLEGSPSADILFFNAMKDKQAASLNWVVNNSFETDFFIIEHSLDGERFEVIEKMEVSNASEDALTYQTMHLAPTTGTNYYRTIQIFSDGSIRESSTRVLHFEEDMTQISLFPNPASDALYLNAVEHAGSSAIVYIYNQLGQLVQQKDFNALPSEAIYFDVSELRSGIHQVVLALEGRQLIAKKVVLTKK